MRSNYFASFHEIEFLITRSNDWFMPKPNLTVPNLILQSVFYFRLVYAEYPATLYISKKGQVSSSYTPR